MQKYQGKPMFNTKLATPMVTREENSVKSLQAKVLARFFKSRMIPRGPCSGSNQTLSQITQSKDERKDAIDI